MTENAFRESKVHGKLNFPFTVYHVKMPDFIISYPLHYHEVFELIFVTRGALRVRIMDKEEILYQDDMAVILPDNAHLLSMASKDTFTEYFNIIFDFSLLKGAPLFDEIYDSYLSKLANHSREIDCFLKKNTPLQRTLYNPVNELVIHRHESYTSRQMLVLGQVFLIADAIYRFSREVNPDVGSYADTFTLIRKALYFVEIMYGKSIQVRDAAEYCGYSESHFMKLFKESTGQSFNEYLVSYRMMIAQKRLGTTDDRIIDIAFDCGFSDAAYFATAFKKFCGMTPLQYRKSKK